MVFDKTYKDQHSNHMYLSQNEVSAGQSGVQQQIKSTPLQLEVWGKSERFGILQIPYQNLYLGIPNKRLTKAQKSINISLLAHDLVHFPWVQVHVRIRKVIYLDILLNFSLWNELWSTTPIRNYIFRNFLFILRWRNGCKGIQFGYSIHVHRYFPAILPLNISL